MAPGDTQVRLKGVRILSNGVVSGSVDIDKDFWIEVEYWNLIPGSRRLVSIDLIDSVGLTVLRSFNLPSVALEPDPWASRLYPRGLFKTRCKIPGNFLNDGTYYVSVFINEEVKVTILYEKNLVQFFVRETGAMRKEDLTGPWVAVVRPRLAWETVQLE
jgi:lipopolysaccharide transport system ATP-binding protein